MFNDEFRLTQSVLKGLKTMTRRIIKCPSTFKGEYVAGFNVHIRQSDKKIIDYPCMYDADEREFDMGEILPKYKVGEVIAIAQNYKDAGFNPNMLQTARIKGKGIVDVPISTLPGWKNKMFTSPSMMPHRIRITDVRVERLQDISKEDCIKEGCFLNGGDDAYCPHYFYDYPNNKSYGFNAPHEAYAALIDKVSGKGTWERNPFVWVYEFELID